jgi:predicted enzyme related to lactoylglutathione lyase
MTAGPKPGPNVTQVVPFLWVSDLHASLRFYVAGLGFTMTNRWMHDGRMRWCWLTLGDAALMLQEFWTEGPHANVSAERVGVGVSICFMCRDALAIYREVKSRGVPIPKAPFVGNGMWVTSFVDPDGYQLYFESRTDAPEKTELAEEDG